MTEVPLIAGYTEGTMQWKAERLQMINWGGFHGYHPIDFALGSTLMSGASGTGKSTLQDAYTALMMPATVGFNGASNDAKTGRARGADQRNILTYLRGKRDDAPDGEERVLRGDGAPVWGAIAMTFVDDTARRFTAIRVFFAPPEIQRDTEVLRRLITVNGPFDLRDLDQFANGKFDPRTIRARFSGLAFYDGPGRFIDAVTTRLGIGANGDGDKALRLLARVQAGYQVATVDGLYKQMVLEQPATYRAADRACDQFQNLDQSYRDLETDGEKQRLLSRIADLHQDYERSRQRADRLDRYGVGCLGDTPFRLWGLRAQCRLLEKAETHTRQELGEAQASLAKAMGEEASLARQLKEIEEQQRANGGGALEAIRVRIQEETAKRDKVLSARARFEANTEVLALRCPDEETFTDARAAAKEFLSSSAEKERSLTDGRDSHVAAVPELTRRLGELVEEHRSLKRRDGRVPLGHDQARNQIAAACGIRPQDLPFAAELMDVHPDHEKWRRAAEVTLGGVGLTMLIDERRQKHIRETVDALHLDQRINFEGVDLTLEAAEPSDARYISGRLIFKESPFTAWVKQRVAQQNTDHLCVGDPSQLGGANPKVTVNGQTTRGRRGAHGWNRDQKGVLGFSNESRLREIEKESGAIRDDLDGHETAMRALDEEIGRLRAGAKAFQAIIDTEWESIDLARVEGAIADLTHQCEALLEKSDLLAELERQHDSVDERLKGWRKEHIRSEDRVEKLMDSWEEIIDFQDKVSKERDGLERLGSVILSDEDEEHLNEEFDALNPQVDHRGFATAANRLKEALRDESVREWKAASRTADTLSGIFAQFNEKWSDPNRGSSVEAYPEFAMIHDDIVRHGLFERRQAFKRQFQKWSGNDLKLLNDAYERALTDIEERLEPVNHILAGLPFGAQQNRLQIVLRRLNPEQLVAFHKELRALSSNVTQDWSDEQTEERFHRLQKFMTRLAKPEPGASTRRDELLDVRRHIKITAHCVNTRGQVISMYSALGGKSGGESQELVAFIVGAALRYQLGDDTRTKPRFAPVFLDEGFVKSDGEFTARSVQAWRGLGFQLIIGAPTGQLTALEPHMDLNLLVTKNQSTGYSFVISFRDAPELISGETA